MCNTHIDLYVVDSATTSGIISFRVVGQLSPQHTMQFIPHLQE